MTHTVTVQRMTEHGSTQWGIYVDGLLIEGGFFTRGNALRASVQYHPKG